MSRFTGRGRNINIVPNSTIYVRQDDGEWIPARDYQVEAFNRFKSPQNQERPVEYDNNSENNRIKFKIERMSDQRIYIMRDNGTRMPIVDKNDVKVFLLDKDPVTWYDARNYQTWTFFDFVYSGDQERYYASQYSNRVLPNINYVTIPLDNLEPNIIFRMSRNRNGTVFYERNDAGRSRVRISDNNVERQEYSNSYQQMDVPRHNVYNIQNNANTVANENGEYSINCLRDTTANNINFTVVETLNDDEMCVVCNVYKQNMQFLPCKHTTTCSVCAQEIIRRHYANQLSCPMCRGIVTKFKIYTSSPVIEAQLQNPSQNSNISVSLGNPVNPLPFAIGNRPIGRIQLMDNSSNWFDVAFGFKEDSYQNAKMRFNQMYQINNNYLNNIAIGQFGIFNSSDLYPILKNYAQMNVPGEQGLVQLQNVVMNVADIHKDPTLSANATIQVASQLNCLEMINPNKTPEDGITIYSDDCTQGPVCAMATPAGAAYRNYLYNGGQTIVNQIDLSTQLLIFFKSLDPLINWKYKNGYLIFENDEQLRRINRVLVKSPSVRRTARGLIQVGIHTNLGVFLNSQHYDHYVNHVHCSGLPMSFNYNPNITDKNLWLGLGEIFLEAMYENTLLSACINNIKSKQFNPCYLTKIGGGVYGMDNNQIARAIQRACQIISLNGMKLNVVIVNYNNNIENNYLELPTKYPFQNASANSIWDNMEWTSKYC